ncbi:GNAT family protein [Octadecabacter sp. 1_MG-2023]|uniref:GNAT family N-acetyltransferase n=1 Tax=unclassified Octadecabacter TaxID=196158 RepID=UPI001C0A160D|nr:MULTISPECIES: GNAT family protein [unclassified Octadecabacter]MBU2994284.1 GNAT family N-acetyltransferase [Octadecabacter sp. B2R22]MDO6734427.1 GNAT family protein [Octadecabacter sp. 1_MG-2023]
MTLTVTIPTLETERLVLRPPQLSDAKAFMAFLMSERAKFVGGPVAEGYAARSFAGFLGQWMLRGYGYFIGALKSDPETPLGGFGIFHPVNIEEPEFGWALYDAAYESNGYATEAMRTVIPWAWGVIGTDTAQSHIDEGNDASVAVAKALGATFDAEETRIANAPGGDFDDEGSPLVNIWRHHKGSLT